MIQYQRRSVLKTIAAGTASFLFPITACKNKSSARQIPDASNPWIQAEQIRKSIVKPRFPDQDFNITDYGAVGDGIKDNTKAIRDAIEGCSAKDGGRVVVSNGVYRTGPVHLKSGVNLYIDKSATLSFLTDPKHYLPAVFTRWEGMEYMGYSPLIYAFEQENVAITGQGNLDGNADRTTWWPWKGNKQWGLKGFASQKEARINLFNDAENGVPPERRIYADGAYLRPPFIQPYKCRNVLIDGITIKNSPFWLIHPVLSENVIINGVTCQSLGPNSDGCDPESCKNVLIENCYFDNGDDCIALKSGRNADGRRLNTPCENVVIANCKMRAGHGGVVIGSEISGGARNIFVENCEMSSPDLDRGIRIKTNSHRGGVIENFYLRNINIGNVRDAIVINFYYEEGDTGKFDPVVRNVVIENLYCREAQQVFKIRGYKRTPIEGLTLRNLRFEAAHKVGIIENVADLHTEELFINGQEFAV